MTARQSGATDRALKRIQKGSTPYAAAKAEGIALSTIYRCLKRIKSRAHNAPAPAVNNAPP